jgi:hypothetical protein
LRVTELVVAASCGSATITSQSDADALVAACQNVTGDIILATTANETINLDGIQAIEGNLVSEFCSSSCASFTSLSSSTLVSVSQNISLINLSGLTNITFPQLQTVGAPFYLDSLPNLQTLNIPTLSSVGQFHLGSTPKLLSMNLNQLQNVTGQNPSIEIISVSLLYFENLNVNTNLSSFILRDTQSSEGFDMSIPQVDYLEIQPGNGVGLRFSFSTSSGTGSGFVSRVGTLNMSGCNSFEADSTTYDTIILNKNTFSYLNLAPIRVLNNLSILDNGNLNQATLPSNMSIENIEIRDNGVLQGSDLSAGVGSWPWGIKNISSMILEGPFEPNFLWVPSMTVSYQLNH